MVELSVTAGELVRTVASSPTQRRPLMRADEKVLQTDRRSRIKAGVAAAMLVGCADESVAADLRAVAVAHGVGGVGVVDRDGADVVRGRADWRGTLHKGNHSKNRGGGKKEKSQELKSVCDGGEVQEQLHWLVVSSSCKCIKMEG